MQYSVRFPDISGAEAFTAQVRREPPRVLAGVPVKQVVDYEAGVEGLPPTDLVELELADDARVLVRPSGTEPKVKCYFEVVGASDPAAQLTALRDALVASVGTMPA
jgi:phosphomannomutase